MDPESFVGPWIMPLLVGEYDRVSSLRAHGILDTGADQYLDEIVQEAALDLGMPIARLSLVDSHREWTKAAFGLPPGFSVPRGLAFCSYTILDHTGLTVVNDATLDMRFCVNPCVIGAPGIRFYGGAPLKDSDGNVLGALSVMDIRPRKLGPEMANRLSFLAAVASAHIALYRSNTAFRDSEEHYRSAVDLNPQIPWTAAANGSIEEASPRWLELTGMTFEQARGSGWTRAVHPKDLDALVSHWKTSCKSGADFDAEYRLRVRDGSYRWCRARAAAKRDPTGGLLRWYGTTEDIHEKKLATLALCESETRLRQALDVGGLGAWEYYPLSGQIIASDQCAKTFGLQSGEELCDYQTVLATVHPEDRSLLEHQRQLHLVGEHHMDVQFRAIWPEGSVRWIRLTGKPGVKGRGEPRRVFGLAVDVTEKKIASDERERTEAQLIHLANHDALTDLANRRLFDARLQSTVATASADAWVALFYMDLDDFKSINDTLGHEAGDWLLQQTAMRLGSCVGVDDTLARIGGDEFAVLMADVRDIAEIHGLARRMLEAVSSPIDLSGRPILLGGSIGASIAQQPASSPGQLAREADMALYRAKHNGGNTYRVFDARMDEAQRSRDELKFGFHDALGQDQLRLHYQPIIDLAAGCVQTFEALIRWEHPQRGLLLPEQFIALAEETGWTSRFGRWALMQACTQAVSWPDSIHVAVNLSFAHFRCGPVVDDVIFALARSGLAADRLELEVTESLLLAESEANLRTLEMLRRLGVRLVMDDFGTGYSSLGYLRRFKFDKMKIDKSLIMGLPDSDGGDTIVRAILGLGRSLGIVLTAEGVESSGQLAFLRRNRCAQAQGYLFSRPVPASLVSNLAGRRWSTG